MTVTVTELLTEAAEARADRAIASVDRQRRAHDVTDRRANNMQKVLDVLGGMSATADAIGAGNLPPGIGWLLGDQIRRLMIELETFRARDLLNLREQAAR